MPKYDIHHEFFPNTSHEKILSQIKSGCTVLECGCATGYMTQYMQEKQNAQVTIIEYDAEAYEIARQFATDGICADLTGDKWSDYLAGRVFDYILFVDVLEHLTDPETVLKKAVSFLADDGKVLMSIPNVAHNDVLINLFNDTWHYTELGLLDNTHLRFWGERDLEPFCNAAKLKIVRQDCTTAPTFSTEQGRILLEKDGSIYPFLGTRSTGEIYQFIVTACHKDYAERYGLEKEVVPHKEQYYCRLYYCGDEAFFADNRSFFRVLSGPDSEFWARFEFQEETVRQLRFDPIELTGCIVQNLSINSDIGSLHWRNMNGIHLANIEIFTTIDPQISIDLAEQKSPKWVEIRAQISAIPYCIKSSIEVIIDEVIRSRGQIQELLAQSARTEAACTHTQELLAQAVQAGSELSAALTAERELGRLEAQEKKAVKEKNFSLLAEREILHMNYGQLETQCEKLKTRSNQLEICREQLQLELDTVLSSHCWRMTKPLRVILDKIKKKFLR